MYSSRENSVQIDCVSRHDYCLMILYHLSGIMYTPEDTALNFDFQPSSCL